MKLLFKQRFFSWFDSYDIYDEAGNTVFTVEGQLSLSKCLNVYDPQGNLLGYAERQILTFLPKFDIHIDGEYKGTVTKEFSFFKPSFDIDYLGWHVDGDIFEWDYEIVSATGEVMAVVSKELFNFTDTYMLDIKYPQSALHVLMLVLAIDAEKESRN